MKNLHCPRKHRVYRELNKALGYKYFCPKCDENFHRIELELRTSDREIAHLVESSNGELWLNADGDVIIQRTNDECGKVVWFDLDEYEQLWGKVPDYHIDILDLRGVFATGEELMFTVYKRKLYGS